METTKFDLRDEILACWMPNCVVGCSAVAAEINMTREHLVMSCPECRSSREHVLNTVPDLVFRILYADFVDHVEGVQ